MPDGHEDFALEVVEGLAQVPAAQWDACTGRDHPFVCHAFLKSLEDAGCVSAETGWAPRHILLKDGAGALLGCAPAYLKGHSMGEYVFDWNWAEAYERAGGRYYPKLLCAAPFTPVTGPRLLVRDDLPPALRQEAKRRLAQALMDLTQGAGLSGAHVNFLTDEDAEVLRELGFTPRSGIQYHWKNNTYDSFDDFLDDLSSRKRKALRKERRAVQDAGLEIQRLSGPDIRERHWDAMHAFYQDTGRRKWGRPYLNREFFRLLGERMADQVLLVLALRGGKPIAGALNLIGGDALYGRYWGCTEEVPHLHFELCYHQAIEAAIERRLPRVEAGAQGEHKIARGYLPVYTRSAHFLAPEGLASAVAEFTARERKALEEEMALLQAESPYRRDGGAG